MSNPNFINAVIAFTACGGLALVGLTFAGIALKGGLPRIKAVLGLGMNAGLLGFGGICCKVMLAALKAVDQMKGSAK